jgi:outer membrane receptor protein involved in Fe transport
VPANVVANGYYYNSPVIPWQYTMNAAVFYQIKQYVLTFSVYNLTDRLNWQAANPFYGNDFLVRNDPRTFEARLQVKF